MDFKALEYICAINDAKTISQAAKNLFISQPALSQYLSKTEQELGMPIFVRTGSIMTPTAAGELLIREGHVLLKNREEMMDQLSRLSIGQMETVRFGISPFYSKYYLPRLLQHYREHFPQIKLEVIERPSTDLEQLVLDGALNLCFIPTEPARDGLIYRPIYMEEIMIGLPANHPANSHAIPAPDRPCMDLTLLRSEPFISLVPELKFYRMSQRIMRHFSIQPEITFETSNWDTVCRLVAGGIGVGLLPGVLIHKYLEEPVFYRIAGIDATRAYAAVYAEGKRLSRPELTLIDTFMDLLKDITFSNSALKEKPHKG